jgi:hypothetical protein
MLMRDNYPNDKTGADSSKFHFPPNFIPVGEVFMELQRVVFLFWSSSGISHL